MTGGCCETRVNRAFAGRVPGDALFTRAPEHPPWRSPKYAGFRTVVSEASRPPRQKRATSIPTSSPFPPPRLPEFPPIGRLRVGTSGTLINKGLAGRLPGDALNTRASGHLFLEMHLCFRPRVFPILPLSVRCFETRADKDFKAGALKLKTRIATACALTFTELLLMPLR